MPPQDSAPGSAGATALQLEEGEGTSALVCVGSLGMLPLVHLLKQLPETGGLCFEVGDKLPPGN